MDRRNFLKVTGVATAGTVAGAATAWAGFARSDPQHKSARELSLSVAISGGVDGVLASSYTLRGMLDAFAVAIASATDGRITLQAEHADRASYSDADLVLAFGDHAAERSPALAAFGGTPVLAAGSEITAGAVVNWLVAGGGLTIWDAIGQEAGFKPLPIGVCGGSAELAMIGGLGGPGFASGLTREVLSKALGAEVQPLAQLKPAGAMSPATVCGLGLTDIAQLFPRPVDIRFEPLGLAFTGPVVALFMAREAWDDLSPADQTLLSMAAFQQLLTNFAGREAFEREVLPALPAYSTWQYAASNPVEAVDAARQIIGSLRARDHHAGLLIDSLHRFAQPAKSAAPAIA